MRRRRLQGWACGQGAGWHAWQGNGRIAKAQPVVAGGGGAVPVLNTARGPRRMLPAPPRHAGSLAAPPARLASLKRPAQGAGRSPARCPPCGRVPATPGRRPPWRASLGHRRRAPVLCGVVRGNRVRSLVFTGAALPRTARAPGGIVPPAAAVAPHEGIPGGNGRSRQARGRSAGRGVAPPGIAADPSRVPLHGPGPGPRPVKGVRSVPRRRIKAVALFRGVRAAAGCCSAGPCGCRSRADRAVFRSDGNSRLQCSTDLLMLVSESTGGHAPVVGGSGQR